MLQLIKHAVISIFRAGFTRGGWGARIVMAILALYFTLLAVSLAIFLPDIIEEYRGDYSTLEFTARYVFYFLCIDILLRFAGQGIPKVHLNHYVLLPVPYRMIVRYILGLSYFNLYNALALIVFIPFSIQAIAVENDVWTHLYWLSILIAILGGNTMLGGHLKRLFANNNKVGFILLGIALSLLLIEWISNAALQNASGLVFSYLMRSPISLILFAYPLLTHRMSKYYLLQNRYSEQWQVKANERTFWSRLDWHADGSISSLIATEWKLIIRHKRTRTAVLFSLFFIFYGYFMYRNVESSSPANLLVALFIVSFSSINYGQFLIAWEARYFDGLLTRSQSMYNYFNAKWRLLALLVAIPYLFSLLYGFVNVRLLIIHSVAALYCVGINNYMILFFSTYQRKAVDLNSGSAFNYQGSSAVQFLLVIPLLLFPLLVYGLVAWPFGEVAGWCTLSIISVISLCCHQLWMRGIANNFREKKYEMADAFRSKEL